MNRFNFGTCRGCLYQENKNYENKIYSILAVTYPQSGSRDLHGVLRRGKKMEYQEKNYQEQG